MPTTMSTCRSLARTCSGAHLANADEQIRGSEASLRLLEETMRLGTWPMTEHSLSRSRLSIPYACSVQRAWATCPQLHHTCNNTATKCVSSLHATQANPARLWKPPNKHQPTNTKPPSISTTHHHQPTRPNDPAPPNSNHAGLKWQLPIPALRPKGYARASCCYCTLLYVSFRCLCLVSVFLFLQQPASPIAFPIDCAIFCQFRRFSPSVHSH